MSDDWQPGDLALCVGSGRWFSSRTGEIRSGPETGSISTVSRVETFRFMGKLHGVLWFEEWPGTSRSGYSAGAFRKIRPHTPDEEDEETIRLLRSAPVHEPA